MALFDRFRNRNKPDPTPDPPATPAGADCPPADAAHADSSARPVDSSARPPDPPSAPSAPGDELGGELALAEQAEAVAAAVTAGTLALRDAVGTMKRIQAAAKGSGISNRDRARIRSVADDVFELRRARIARDQQRAEALIATASTLPATAEGFRRYLSLRDELRTLELGNRTKDLVAQMRAAGDRINAGRSDRRTSGRPTGHQRPSADTIAANVTAARDLLKVLARTRPTSHPGPAISEIRDRIRSMDLGRDGKAIRDELNRVADAKFTEYRRTRDRERVSRLDAARRRKRDALQRTQATLRDLQQRERETSARRRDAAQQLRSARGLYGDKPLKRDAYQRRMEERVTGLEAKERDLTQRIRDLRDRERDIARDLADIDAKIRDVRRGR